MSPGRSHLVEILLPKETGKGQPIGQHWLDCFLKELSDRFGGATSFLRAPGQGLWQSGGGTEKDSIAVVEVMVEEIDSSYWQTLRERLQRELSQEEIIIRAQEIRRL
ncbi:hypothetical protein JQ609_33205 [Bradyrhizobium sp. AUGA SZCCT0169]|uniref:hypothetical protein n=1 Tax=Bradyrhizobium sp. AUGA SZCCT0169 TaxID=2807663 RepID=UPI001BAD16BB|nr:hypothetical protein [Bradyrhizobium sp. AUGA SZCCT0169]MBR1251760.1 hypothetical protein [Bradyrhizobium sp. AUGA SZCCT0169]